MSTDLKPCPFCGRNPESRRVGLSERFSYADEVIISCACGVSRSAMGDTSAPGYADNRGVEERAVSKWNTRSDASLADAQAEIARLRGALEKISTAETTVFDADDTREMVIVAMDEEEMQKIASDALREELK